VGPRVRKAYKYNNNYNYYYNYNNNNKVIRLVSLSIYICTPNPRRAIKTVKTPSCSSSSAVQPDTYAVHHIVATISHAAILT